MRVRWLDSLKPVRNERKKTMCGYHMRQPLADSRVKKKMVPAAGSGSRRGKASRTNAGSVHGNVINLQVPMPGVWTVVSNLFKALSEARDDLLSLMSRESFQGLQNLTLSKPGTSWKSKAKENNRSRSSFPHSFSALVESLRSSYGTKEDHATVAGEETNGTRKANPSAEYCVPVAFGMNLDFERVQPGRSRSPPANSTSQQQQQQVSRATGCEPPVRSRTTTTTTTSSTTRITTTATSAATARSKGGTASRSAPACCPESGPPYREGKRVCRAAHYANLLRAEANQLRERHFVEEPMIMSRIDKPSWF